jgi:hypothetical protein
MNLRVAIRLNIIRKMCFFDIFEKRGDFYGFVNLERSRKGQYSYIMYLFVKSVKTYFIFMIF